MAPEHGLSVPLHRLGHPPGSAIFAGAPIDDLLAAIVRRKEKPIEFRTVDH
jgi:hypothetical protein